MQASMSDELNPLHYGLPWLEEYLDLGNWSKMGKNARKRAKRQAQKAAKEARAHADNNAGLAEIADLWRQAKQGKTPVVADTCGPSSPAGPAAAGTDVADRQARSPEAPSPF